MKNLVICPSRGRPSIFKRFLDSFRKTSTCSDLVVVIDDDDKTNAQYLEIYDCTINTKPRTVTQLINYTFEFNQGYEFYTVTNDDFVFQTPGWDETLCKRGKISYGNDLCARENLPTTYTVDGDIPRALGWLQMPLLKFMYGDTVWKDLGHALNNLYYRIDVINEHCHWSNLKAPIDEIYKKTNATETFNLDSLAYRQWKQNDFKNDVEKVREVLCRLQKDTR